MPRAIAGHGLIVRSLSGFWWGAGLLLASIVVMTICVTMQMPG